MTKQHNSENPLSVEYWEKLGIKPIVVDTSSVEDVSQKANEITDRIKNAVEELKTEEQHNG